MSFQTAGASSARNHLNVAVVGDVSKERKEEIFESLPARSSPLVPSRNRSSSQGLIGPGFDFVSPHVLDFNSKNTAFISKPIMEQVKEETLEADGPRSQQQEAMVLNVDTQKHSYFTSEQANQDVDWPTSQKHCAADLNSAPEVYLICTSKERSETTYSSESQGSAGGTNEPETIAGELSGVGFPSSPETAEVFWSCQQPVGKAVETQQPLLPSSSVERDHLMADLLDDDLSETIRDASVNLATLGPSGNSPPKRTRGRPIPPPKQRNHHDSNEPFSPPESSSLPESVSLALRSPVHRVLHPSPKRSQTSPRLSPPSFPSSRRFTGVGGGNELMASQRLKAISFLGCKAGEERGTFHLDYLGSKETDRYVKSVNSITKQLMSEQRPREMIVYVSSEKIRLAPPNSATLFQSFAVKDVMWVRKCSKNKHIVAIVMWKSVTIKPVCHILRCRDNVMAKSLFDMLWEQTQNMDEISVGPEKERNQEQDKREGGNQDELQPSLFMLRPMSINSTSSSEDSNATPTPPVGEILHRFPAIYIGSTSMMMKSGNIDDVVSKVLNECSPSAARNVTVALSLSEVQLFLRKKPNMSPEREREQEKILSHETSRVRLTGVFSEDRRFCGYIIKEVGKPQEGHVIRCNSAALMTSFTSFLRQSCQLTSPQRGASFYDEISTDESDDWDCSSEPHSSSMTGSIRLVNRIKSLTCSITQLSASSTSPANSTLSMPRPTFQSHTRPLEPASVQSSTLPASAPSPILTATMSDDSDIIPASIQSPLDFSEEEYSKFQVSYLGSATQDYPLTQHSVGDALYQFSKDGTSGGQAAITKNTVSLQVSLLGINLTDKSRKLFVHRNYPLKTIIGFCQHFSDGKHFAFATERPGFPNLKKVHVFRCLAEPPEQILAAMKYWLHMDPIVSGPIPASQVS